MPKPTKSCSAREEEEEECLPDDGSLSLKQVGEFMCMDDL
jgi:hypothetical protein